MVHEYCVQNKYLSLLTSVRVVLFPLEAPPNPGNVRGLLKLKAI